MEKVGNDADNFKDALMSSTKVKKKPGEKDGDGKTTRSEEEERLRKMLGKED